MTEVAGMSKPDWYLKINPVSSIADRMFFVSTGDPASLTPDVSKSVGKFPHSEFQLKITQ
jgi:hypothetical protein